jgi:hypothetical protein
MKFILIKLSSYDPNKGFKEWYEIQKQYDEENYYINLENIIDASNR